MLFQSTAIILCAGPINFTNLPVATNQSNAMLAINGLPVIGWILNDLITKGIENIVVVHHSHCGATSFTTRGITEAWELEHHVDISGLYDSNSICIENYEASLKHDTKLIRSHLGTPKHVNIFGYFYDIDSGELAEVVADRAGG